MRNFLNRCKNTNSFILFLPYLFFYVGLGIYFRFNGPVGGDEGHYFQFAQNLRHGFYSSRINVDLWYGPGFPIYLLVGSFLGLSKLGFVIMNGVFLYLSVVIFNITTRKYLDNKNLAFYSSIFLASYAVTFRMISFIHPELFTIFLVSSILFLALNAFNHKSFSSFFILGLSIGYLALTKVIFGLVLLMLLVIFALMLTLRSRLLVSNLKSFSLIFVGAYLILTPYLLYTFSLTGKIYYLGNSGGENLYFMSTLNNAEYGDWQDSKYILGKNDALNVDAKKFGYVNFNDSKFLWQKSHKLNLEQSSKYNSIERNDYFIKLAISNIKNNPIKYLKNIGYNFSRLLFNLPYSYNFQDAKFWIYYFTNGILFFWLIILLPLIFKRFRRFNSEIIFLLFFYVCYIILTLLLSAYSRQFWVMTPMLLFILAWISDKFINLKISFK